MGGSLVSIFHRISAYLGQITNTQLFTCKQLVLVEVSESLKYIGSNFYQTLDHENRLPQLSGFFIDAVCGLLLPRTK